MLRARPITFPAKVGFPRAGLPGAKSVGAPAVRAMVPERTFLALACEPGLLI